MGLISLGNLLARPLTRNRVAGAVLFFSLGAIFVSLGVSHRNFPDSLLFLYGLHTPTYFLMAPLLRAYFRGVATQPSEPLALPFPGYGWLIPFGVALLIYLPTYFMPPDFKRPFLEYDVEGPYLYAYSRSIFYVGLAGIGSVFYAMVRLVIELRIVSLLFKGGSSPVLWHFRVMALSMVVTPALGVIAQLSDSLFWKQMAIGCVAVSVLWFYLLDHRFPSFFHRLDREIREHSAGYSKSRLENLDTAAVIQRLERVMGAERLYVDEELSREKLAAAVDLQPAQLSELLNTVMGVDYRQYINQYRVESAQQMLIREPERTILSIGLAAGFNSKASFNRNFKAVTGQTPAEYRAARMKPES